MARKHSAEPAKVTMKPKCTNKVKKNKGKETNSAIKRGNKRDKKELAKYNVYEDSDDGDGAGPSNSERKFNDVDVYEYKLPENFDDEEIDEDEAFDDEDNLRYGDMNLGGKKSSEKHDSDSDAVSEASEDDLDLEGEDGMDISEMFNDDSNANNKAAKQDFSEIMAKSRSTAELEAIALDEGDNSDNERDERGDAIRHSGLLSAIDKLDKGGKAANKWAKLSEINESVQASEFALTSNQREAGRGMLTMDDLMKSVGEASGLGGLKKQLEHLAKGDSTLPVPMAKRALDRVSRKVAFEQSAMEVSKWTSVVKRDREAEHLSFPMNAPELEKNSNAELASKFEARTDLEKNIGSVLDDSTMQELEGGFLKGESLELQNLDPQEKKERRQELQKMRALLSYYEKKRARINKIKSKGYHKKLKQEAKKKAGANDLMQADMVLSQEEQLKAERERAQERMTLRHKNTSKWAKNLLRRNTMDPTAKAQLEEQLRRGNELRKKINDDSDGDSVDGSGDELEEDEMEEDYDSENETETDRLLRLQRKMDRKGEETSAENTGVMGMKFMKRAMERKRKAAMQELEAAKEELERLQKDSGAESSDSDEEVQPTKKGRNQAVRKELKDGESQIDAVTLSRGHTTKSSSGVSLDLSAVTNSEEGKNGLFDENWKVSAETSAGVGALNVNKRKANVLDGELDVEARLSAEKKLEAEIAERRKKSKKERIAKQQHTASEESAGESDSNSDGSDESTDESESEGEDATDSEAEADAANPWFVAEDEDTSDKKSEKSKTKSNSAKNDEPSRRKKTRVTENVSAAEKDGDEEEETEDEASGEEEEDSQTLNLEVAGEKQRKLIEEAFAGDDVVDAFEEAKEEEIGEDGPKTKEVELPGWGSWGGDGVQVSQRELARKEEKKALAMKKKRDAAKKRKDSNLPHVIINEKRDKKQATALVKSIPHMFDTREQYERAMRNPVGKEWNTPSVFNKNIKPAISIKAGAVIAPRRKTKEVKMAVPKLRKQNNPRKFKT
ncbi:hypothetical protein SARC_10568 [Sphaeroforma arctica JP610]|uniref:Uncharacterized protein n=1 Tax=Sphaeroforma arctica JP610 TaxID=667725 RepID=A0A0L0FJI9_9EUKA|nr:hypothetical protein SARC_10568 [Sphaeroforma arctica JP610]KNC76954.1 hypothetical protein SARC_10568 [Sphaeroforma arctica JP610]|eukprot:XP_014150856.1 hypothetical protein SARC_10568 [Sphaeroforma arctica JP610]